MKKLSIYALSAVCILSVMQACNDDTPTSEVLSTNTAVYSFSFLADKNVLPNLDTVFFSIDLVKGQIYNADSMPFGTKVSRLIPQIKMADGVAAAKLSYRTASGRDSVYDYLSNPGDSVDFSYGPAILTVVAQSGSVTRDYTINVNVHKVKPDSLVWGESAFSALPTSLESVTAQRSAVNRNGVYCLTTDGTSYSLAHTSDTRMIDWTKTSVTLPAGADVNSFSAADTHLYILDADGKLYTSNDGSDWTNTGSTWKYIYGDCAGTLGGVAEASDGSLRFEQYPAGVTKAIPADMPVSGTSLPVNYQTPMASGSQCVILGGRKADGSLTNTAWAFDGNAWVKVSNTGLPKNLEGITMVPFFTYYISSVYVPTEYSIFMAFGGTDGSSINSEVYISNDYGMSWKSGSALVQLPQYVVPGAFSQGFVRNAVLYPSRATRPVEEWECPYIYLFGGLDSAGQLNNAVWRGTLNRMTFKPII